MAVQEMNIEILPLQGQIKHLGQLIIFNNAVQVEFDHRTTCAWATFTSHIRELTSPKYPLKDRLNLFGATVTPSVFYASGTWRVTEEVKKKLQTTQRRMVRMIIQTEKNRYSSRSCACREGRRHRRRRTPRPWQRTGGRDNTEDLNELEESSHDADSTPCFDSVPQDDPEDDFEP